MISAKIGNVTVHATFVMLLSSHSYWIKFIIIPFFGIISQNDKWIKNVM